MVSGECTRLICRLNEEEEADYSGFLGLPLGTGVECVRADALLEAHRLAASRYDREHVCPFLYRHPERFIIHRPEVSSEYRFPEGRVTLDTEEDYEILKELFSRLYRGSPVPTDLLVQELARHQSVAR